jgi:hypothetical protein
MLEGIDVATLGAVPCPFLGVRIAFMDHLNNQVTVQTHRWFAIDKLLLSGLPHGWALLFEFLIALAIHLPGT